MAQAEYDKQTEITRLLMEGLSAIQTNHLRHLKSYVESQTKFYANCHQIMQDLNRELANTTLLSEGETGMPILRPGVAAPRPPPYNAAGARGCPPRRAKPRRTGGVARRAAAGGGDYRGPGA